MGLVSWRVSGQSGAVPASSERHGARFGGLRMRSGAPPETGKPAPSLGGRVCLDEGFYQHRQGPGRGVLPDHVRRSARPESGSDPAGRRYLGPVN